MEIVEVNGDLNEFLNLALKVYENDPVWCGESGEDILNTIRHTRYKGSWIRLFMIKDLEFLARASASIDPGSGTGYIGHFEALRNENEAVNHLLKHVENELRDKGAIRIIAPRSDIMSLGLQIGGFDLPQTWRTPHNPSYYREYFESNGYGKKEDLLTFIMGQDTIIESPDPVDRIKIRKFNIEDLEGEIGIFNRLNNAIFSSHENFTERTLEEDTIIIGSMLPYLDEDLVLIAEKDDEPIGFLVCVPDHNQMIREDRLTRARLITIGLLSQYTGQGIGMMMADKLKEALVSKGFLELEGSWVLESNTAPRKMAGSIGGSLGRVFRVYVKDI
ncbi:MAG: N-acetyltransferase family protein [Thermoplasmatota archaeon]